MLQMLKKWTGKFTIVIIIGIILLIVAIIASINITGGSSPAPRHHTNASPLFLAMDYAVSVTHRRLCVGFEYQGRWTLHMHCMAFGRPTGQCAHPKTEVALEGWERTGLARGRARLWPADRFLGVPKNRGSA